MPSKFLVQEMDGSPKQICFANHGGDFSPAAANDLRITTDGTKETDAEFVLLNLADGAAAQSAKVDLGEHRASKYAVTAALEMQVAAATAGGIVEFYWNPSPSSTAANANCGGADGTASSYSGYSSDLDEAVDQLQRIGVMVMTDDAVDSLQIGFVGTFSPIHRYGSLVVKNECGQTICDTDDIESHVVMNPIVDESQ